MSDALNDAAVRGVVRLSRHVEMAVGEFQLSVSQYRILDRLAGGSAPGRSLAEWLAVKPPSITGLVDVLVARGLVERSADASDRRRVTHELTAEGLSLYRAASQAVASRLSQIVDHLDDPERAGQMIAALARWNDAIDLAREAKQAVAHHEGNGG